MILVARTNGRLFGAVIVTGTTHSVWGLDACHRGLELVFEIILHYLPMTRHIIGIAGDSQLLESAANGR